MNEVNLTLDCNPGSIFIVIQNMLAQH